MNKPNPDLIPPPSPTEIPPSDEPVNIPQPVPEYFPGLEGVPIELPPDAPAEVPFTPATPVSG